MMTKQQKLIAAGAVIVVLGGWGFAKHQASTIARDKIDGFLIRHNLRDTVSYADLSASPFGSATLSGVKVKVSPTTAITIGALDISDVEMKNDQLHGIAITAGKIEVPLLALAREQQNSDRQIHNAIGMGYTTLTGDISAALRYDDQKGMVALQTTGEVKDAGSWKVKFRMGGVDATTVNTLYGLANAPAQTKGLAWLALAGQGLQGLAAISLAEADVTVDNSGMYKRNTEITNLELPSDGNPAGMQEKFLNEEDLVRAGMAPSEAQASRATLDNWLKKGGSLRVATNLIQPLPLLRNGNLSTPAFDSPASYLVATKSRISN